MRKLMVAPGKSGYTVADGTAALEAVLSGGLPRTRLDFLGAVATVEVQWSVDPDTFQYLRAFFRTGSKQTSEPFLIDLVLDDFPLAEYTAKFVPGSLRITGVEGLTTTCAAQLRVKPQAVNETLDNSIMDLYEASGGASTELLAGIERLANVVMPDTLGL